MASIRKNILFYVLSGLVISVLISFFLLSGIYAKYTTSVGGSDTARVAVFDVGNSGAMFETSFAVELDPTTEEDIANALILTNSSEVAVNCNVTIESVADLPLIFTWQVDDDEYVIKSGEPVTFTCAPQTELNKTFDLNIAWDTASEENTSFIYRRQVDKLVLSIECEQID